MSEPDEVEVLIDGVRLCVHRSGRPDGPTLVVLHGFTGSAEAMEPIVEQLRSDHRVLAIDLVGHGKSDVPDELAAYEMGACVAQIAAVLDELTEGPARLIGYSMGGRAALSFAIDHPQQVASLHLVGATAGLRTETERADRRAADDALADRILTGGLESFVDHWMSIPLFASQVRLGEPALAAARAQRLRCDPVGLANSLRGMGTGSMPPLHDRLAGLAVPTQLIVGQEDQKFHAIATELAAVLPDADVTVISGAGHAAHLEAPGSVAAALRSRIV